jgi:hypothetical protein
MTIEARNTPVAMALWASNILWHCFTGPMRNTVLHSTAQHSTAQWCVITLGCRHLATQSLQ